MKHKTMLQKLCHIDELSNIDTQLFKDDTALLSKLIDDKIGMALDYKYEPPKAISEFIIYRLQKLSLKTITLDFENLENEFKNNEKDNFIEFVLDNFNQQLKKANAKIVLLHTGSDDYVLFITDKKHSKNLTKINSEFWQFYDLSTKNNAKLYTIYCSCGAMNVWELPFDEPAPNEGECDRCQKPLWDKQGKLSTNARIEIDEIYSPEYN